MRINQEGIQVVSEANDISAGFHLKCQSGLCFTETGAIINAAAQTLAGQLIFNFNSGNFIAPTQVAPDVANGIVYTVGTSSVTNQVGVSAYDLNTHQLIRTFMVPGASGNVKDFFIWEGNQLAFNTQTEIVLLPKALLAAP